MVSVNSLQQLAGQWSGGIEPCTGRTPERIVELACPQGMVMVAWHMPPVSYSGGMQESQKRSSCIAGLRPGLQTATLDHDPGLSTLASHGEFR